MADATTSQDNEHLSTFLATFPTQLHCYATNGCPYVSVFWSQTQSNSSSGEEAPQNLNFFSFKSVNSNCCSLNCADAWMIHEKIKSAFSDLYLSQLKGLIQFWAPIYATGGRQLLSTSDQPFVLEHLHSGGLQKYRLCCIGYQYSLYDIDVVKNNMLQVEEGPMIISGAPATAFLNHLPVVVNLRFPHGSPLVCCALECELTSSLMLPVFYHSSTSQRTDCVGVVECSIKGSCLHVIFNKLKSALEKVGLSTFHVEECWPYKSIPGLKLATYEIEEALEIVCESHNLTLAQVWIAENHVPFSPSLAMKQKFAVKLIGYFVHLVGDDDNLSVIKEYYDTCDVLPLKIGEGLAGKTLKTYESHLCKTLDVLSDDGVMALLPANSDHSCLVICLRSTHTGVDNVDYGFEFLWPKSRNHINLLESLLLTLKRCLPSFKFASGAQLGDESRVVDVENPTRSGITILQGNRLSPVTNESLECKMTPIPLPLVDVKQHFGRPMNKVPMSTLKDKNTFVDWQRPKVVKRKLIELCESQIDSNIKDIKANQENSMRLAGEDELVIKAEYGDDESVSLYIPISSKLEDIKKNIADKYKLDSSSYDLQFMDFEDEWMSLDEERDWESCSKSWRTGGTENIRLRVLIKE